MDRVVASCITNNKAKTFSRRNLEQAIEINEHLYNEIKTTLNEVLKTNISQQDLDKFMESLLSIIACQTGQYLNQYKHINQSMQNQFYPDIFGYSSNNFLFLSSSNFVQYYYPKNLYFQPFLYPNRI